MAKILFIKPDEAHKRVRLGIENDDGESAVLKVRESTYTSLGAPGRGCEIAESTYRALVRDDELLRAYHKAVTSLADSDKSRYEMRKKLIMLGFSKDIVDVVLDKCEEYGYLDEARQLMRLVEREANRKLRGRYYIRQKLAAKGYRTADIDRVTNQLVEEGEIDFKKNLKLLSEKKCVSDEGQIKALKYKYGYEK